MNVGFIGTGNMGRILIEAFIESRALQPSQIFITNRSSEKAQALQNIYSNITILGSAEEVCKSSDIIFICLKPLDIYPLLISLAPILKKEQCVVSITSPIKAAQIESIVNCQVARVIPSITNRAHSGISLFTLGKSCSTKRKEELELLFSRISRPVHIKDDVTRVSSDIVSCGPAFFSYLLQRFIDAAVRETNISKPQATELASEMIIGIASLLEDGLYTLPALQEKVCVKGGVTGIGINVLENELGDVFENLFQGTHRKFDEDIDEVQQQFNGTSISP
ncbi:late competence protein ComER [Bacillus lacus]|uniref:Late competence protein ComER n=1 Tax=Metabacillus lacus TaxID=1983721 RepID=A0A7X2IXB9_9BACI|nr:late competence protein ComER [Metabacillus lacus]MRX71334.1 late competence protein ComER [Metabacillus lacus]